MSSLIVMTERDERPQPLEILLRPEEYARGLVLGRTRGVGAAEYVSERGFCKPEVLANLCSGEEFVDHDAVMATSH